MHLKKLLSALVLSIIIFSCIPSTEQNRIIHSVIFNLPYPEDANETKKFLSDGYEILSTIPGVENFQVRYEISPKNDYQYGFYMEFENQEAYDNYNNHPNHTDFVEERWKKEVTKFLEIDYKIVNKQQLN